MLVAAITQQQKVSFIGFKLRESPPTQYMMYLCMTELVYFLSTDFTMAVSLCPFDSFCINYTIVVSFLVTALAVF